jgi:hypothetical protein
LIRRLTWFGGLIGLLIFALVVIVLVDVSAISEPAKRCAPSIRQSQWPIYLGCAVAAHEGLAAGLFGAVGALFAAWLAFAAVREQIANERDLHELQEKQEQERAQEQQARAKEVAKTAIVPAIYAANAASLAINRATANPAGLMDQVKNAFRLVQTALDSSSIREIAPELAVEDRIHLLQITGMMSTLVSISEHGASNPHDRLKALESGLVKLPDAVKKFDPQLAHLFTDLPSA